MVSTTSLIIVIAFVSAAVLVEITKRLALANNLLAHPNARSFHETPTPSMGGIGIVVPVLVLLAYLWLVAGVFLAGLFFVGGFLMAFTGGFDDLQELPASLRLIVQVLAAGLLIYGFANELSWWQVATVLVAIVWAINLTNFMDGIDGLAASQCVLFVVGCQILNSGLTGWVSDLLWILGAANLAFLGFNWAPAKIFMGDLGSGFLGFMLMALVLTLNSAGQLPFIVSLILLTGFWFDASYTLCVRIVSSQRFMSAHRSHLYQKIAARVGHERTTVLFVAFWVVYLLPLAWLARNFPDYQIWCFIAACLPLLISAIVFKAGHPSPDDGSGNESQNRVVN